MASLSRESSNEKTEIEWKLVEQVAALLEKSITPIAKVERNVELPVIGKNRKRQCDVVITYGEEPRQTITIVEVQKRKRKPELTTFHGWYRKMQEVGAQHLICVSTKGYPKSIIDEVATEYGPTVRLLTLEELQEPQILSISFLAPYIFHTHDYYSIASISPNIKLEHFTTVKPESHPELTTSLRIIPINSSDKRFTLNESFDLYSLDELTEKIVKSNFITDHYSVDPKRPIQFIDMFFTSKEHNLWLHWDNQKIRVLNLPITLRRESKIFKIPLTVLAYEQKFVQGTLAWVLISKGKVEGCDIEIIVVFKQDKDGFLKVESIESKGVRKVDLFISPDKESLEAYFSEKTL